MATIVQLYPINEPIRTVTFEEAFGEYSEARGKGRARRAERRARRKQKKLDRIADRDEVKRARTETRQARRSDRKEGRQQNRIERRRRRKEARQNIRSEQQQARQGRKDERVARRMDRRRFKAEERVARKEIMQPEDEYMDQDMLLDEGYDGYGYEDDGYPQDGYSDDGYDDSYDSEYDDGYDSEYDDGYDSEYDDQYPEDGDWIGEEEYMDDYGGEGEYSFDAMIGNSNVLSEMGDGNDNVVVSPKIQDIANKIEWNREKLSRLLADSADDADVIATKDRIVELQSMMAGHMNFSGEYLNADGEPSPNKMAVRRRRKAIRKAFANAKAKRKSIKRGRLTPVESNLSPEFTPNRIVVPPRASAFDGRTGVIALDASDDIGRPAVREVFLGADGATKAETNFRIGGVVLAIAVGVGIVYWLNKEKSM